MRVWPLLLVVSLLPGCGRAPMPVQAPRAVAAAPAARGLAQDALGAYARQLEEVMKAAQANDPQKLQAALEKLLKVLVEALRGISRSLRQDGAPSATVDAAVTDFDGMWARYEALPGDLTGEKARLVQEMEQKLVAALLSQLSTVRP